MTFFKNLQLLKNPKWLIGYLAKSSYKWHNILHCLNNVLHLKSNKIYKIKNKKCMYTTGQCNIVICDTYNFLQIYDYIALTQQYVMSLLHIPRFFPFPSLQTSWIYDIQPSHGTCYGEVIPCLRCQNCRVQYLPFQLLYVP